MFLGNLKKRWNLAWKNHQEVLVMLVVVAVFPHWRFLHFRATFPCHRHSTLASQAREGLHQLWALPWLLSVALRFPGFFVTVLPRALRFSVGISYPQAFFYLTLLHRHFWHVFLTQMRAGTPHPGSSSVPALSELSLLADAWIWTTHIVVTRPLIYRMRQWTTKYRVKIKLMNMFRLFKVIWKDYKNTLNKSW